MLCYLRSLKHRTRQLVVLTVEEVGHMMPKLGVLLGIESAIPAKNMAIMCSIVKVLKKFSLVGEAEHIEKETRSKDIDVPSPLKTFNQVNEESRPRSLPSSSDDEYKFTLSSRTKVSAPFVSMVSHASSQWTLEPV